MDGPGVNITATLTDSENSFVASGIGGSPSWQDNILKPELVAPQTNTAIFGAGSSFWNTVAGSIPGGTGASPDFSLAGAVFIQVVPVDNVTAEVGGDAVIESASGVTVAASLTQTVDSSVTASLTGQDGENGRSRARARASRVRWRWASGYYDPTVHATIDSGARSTPPGRSPSPRPPRSRSRSRTTVNGVEGDILYNPGNPNVQPDQLRHRLLHRQHARPGHGHLQQLGQRQGQSRGRVADGFGRKHPGLPVIIMTPRPQSAPPNINQKASDPECAGTGPGHLVPECGRSRSAVKASTQYENAAEAGTFDLNLAPASLLENIRDVATSAATARSTATPRARTPSGPRCSSTCSTITTFATIDSGARIGIGSAGALDVDADQTIIAVSLVQSGDAAATSASPAWSPGTT